MISILAGIATVLTGLAIVLYALLYFIIPKTTRGFLTLPVAVLYHATLELFCLSIIAEYLGRIFEDVAQRPLYITRHIANDHKAQAGLGIPSEVTKQPHSGDLPAAGMPRG